MAQKAGHTPGPWSWMRGLEPYSDQHTLSPGVLIANGTDGTPDGDAIDQANARLIAAAPDLLEALVTALPYIETAEQDEAYKPGAVAKVTAQVRAALTKAGAL